MENSLSLVEALSLKPKDGREMVQTARMIIHKWINEGLPYPTPEIDVLVGIESQSDHLLGSNVKPVFGSPFKVSSSDHENEELDDIFLFFEERYEVARNALINYLYNNRS